MQLRIIYAFIGIFVILDLSAQDISKPIIKKTEVQTPKRTTTVVSKKKAASRVIPQRKRNSSYNSSSNS